MALSKATLDALIESADTAMAAGSYSAALDLYIRAKGVLDSLPNTEQTTWNRMGLDGSIKSCKARLQESSDYRPRTMRAGRSRE